MSQRSRSKLKTAHLFQRVIKNTLMRPEELTVSQWAEKYRVLSEASNISGKWSNAITPYLVGIMDAFNDPHIREIYFCKSTQVGGTEALINILCYCITQQPAPAMIVYPSDDLAKDISSEKLKPAFRLIPEVKKIFYEGSSKELKLRFKTMALYLRGAGSPSKLASKEIKYLFLTRSTRWAVLLRKRHRLLTWLWSEPRLIKHPEKSMPAPRQHWLQTISGICMIMQMKCGITLCRAHIVGK